MGIFSFPLKKKQLSFIKVTLLSIGVVSFIGLTSCHRGQDQNTATSSDSTVNDPAMTAATPPASPFSDFKKFDGEYPKDVNLLDQKELKDRLKALLGQQYDDFSKYWQTETPIEIDSEVLATTGCEAHNCAGNQWILQIDLAGNNINVYHFGTQGIQSYLEKGKIRLPAKLEEEFQTISANSL